MLLQRCRMESAPESEFWRHARQDVWPKHRTAAAPEAVDCDALGKFDEMIELLKQPVIDKADWDRMCAVPLTSYAQMSQGLGISPRHPRGTRGARERSAAPGIGPGQGCMMPYNRGMHYDPSVKPRLRSLT